MLRSMLSLIVTQMASSSSERTRAAARPEIAIPLYEKFIALCRDKGFAVETGEFGAEMLVESVNDGPVTLIVDTDQL